MIKKPYGYLLSIVANKDNERELQYTNCVTRFDPVKWVLENDADYVVLTHFPLNKKQYDKLWEEPLVNCLDMSAKEKKELEAEELEAFAGPSY